MKSSKTSSSEKILKKLHELYPDANCALEHKNPFELLVSTILSAQCTDERVNKVTPKLFKQFPNAKKMSQAPIETIEGLIRSTGFFRSKAKSLHETSSGLVKKFKGEVPQTMDELIALRGVGRKTANVVLGNAFGINHGVVVDTHVGRLSRRMGFSKHKDPVKVEKDLMKLVPQKDWTLLSHQLISHGRAYCRSQNPQCTRCPLSDICPSALNTL